MKKMFLLPAILLIGFTSCKKNSDNKDIPVGTISVSIGGTTTSFNHTAKALAGSVQNGFGIQIHGYKKDPTLSLTDVTIWIVSPSPIGTGTYIENIAGNPLVSADHFQEFILGVGNVFSSYYSTTNPLTVSITAISASSVKGTFQGELKGLNLNGDTTTMKLTNGVFHVSF
jgi:hypothetical protein